MADVLFVVVLVAFFALAALLVRACDRVVGRDEGVHGEEVDDRRVGAGRAA